MNRMKATMDLAHDASLALVGHARRGDVAATKQLLEEIERKEGPNAVFQAIVSCEHGDRNAMSALHSAAMSGHSDVVKILLGKRGDPNCVDDSGNTPLHFAAELGRARCVRALLCAGAVADTPNNFGRKPRDKAVAEKWNSEKVSKGKEFIRRMLDVQVDDLRLLASVLEPEDAMPSDEPCEFPQAPSGKIAEKQPTTSRSSVSSGVPDVPSRTATEGSGDNETANSCPICLEQLAATDPRWPACTHQFHLACLATLRQRKQYPVCAMCRAPWPQNQKFDAELSRSLKQHNIIISPEREEEIGPTYLVELVRANDLARIETWLSEALARGGAEAVRQEVTNCEEGPQDTRVAQSPLHCAAQLGRVETLKLLLSTGATPNAVTDAGNTPLHLAVDAGCVEAVMVLLSAGADPRIRNNFGRSPAESTEPQPWDSPDMRVRRASIRQSLTGESSFPIDLTSLGISL